MNLIESFKDYLESLLGLTFGQDLFIGQAPSSNKVQDSIWWINGSGGAVVSTNVTAERTKERIIEIYCRSRDYKAIYDNLEALEAELNCANCVELEGYDVLDITAQPLFVDLDLDGEDRKVGLLQVNISVYQQC